MKLFTFLSEEQLHIDPEQKIIPEEAYTKLLSLEEILEKAQKDVKTFQKQAKEKAQELYEQKEKEGFQEGLQKLNEHILKMDRVIAHLEKNLQEKIVPLALTAAKKIVGEELKLHPDRIVQIVQQALKPVTHHHHITIYVNKEDLQTLEKHKPEIKKKLQQIQSLSFQERADIQAGGCMIETEAGIINAQLDNQWRALENALRSFQP